jgi:hypothetical protein
MLKTKTIEVVRTEIYPDYEVFRISSGKGMSLKSIHTQNVKDVIYLGQLQQI